MHVEDEDQELVFLEKARMGEQQKQVVVGDEEQEKGTRVDPNSSSSPPPQNTRRHSGTGDGRRWLKVWRIKAGPMWKNRRRWLGIRQRKGKGNNQW